MLALVFSGNSGHCHDQQTKNHPDRGTREKRDASTLDQCSAQCTVRIVGEIGNASEDHSTKRKRRQYRHQPPSHHNISHDIWDTPPRFELVKNVKKTGRSGTDFRGEQPAIGQRGFVAGKSGGCRTVFHIFRGGKFEQKQTKETKPRNPTPFSFSLLPSVQFFFELDATTWTEQIRCMKTITVNVSEPIYESFQRQAKKMDRKAAELIREAMECYHRERIQRRTSLRDRLPAADVGAPIEAIGPEDDILGEMLDDARD